MQHVLLVKELDFYGFWMRFKTLLLSIDITGTGFEPKKKNEHTIEITTRVHVSCTVIAIASYYIDMVLAKTYKHLLIHTFTMYMDVWSTVDETSRELK